MVVRTSLLLFCVLQCAACLGQNSRTRSTGDTIYVSGSTGNDQWDGSAMTKAAGNAGPVASLQRAKALVKALNNGSADTIYVKIGGGMYAQSVQFGPEDGGNGKSIVVYEAADPGNKPVFTGAKTFTAQVNGSPEIITVPLPDVQNGKMFFEQLYLNGEPLTRAREPNTGVASVDAIREDTLQGPKAPGGATQLSMHHFQSRSLVNNGIYSKLSQLPPKDLNHVLVTILYKWNVAKRYVSALDQSQKMFATKGPGEGAILKWNPGTFFYLENSKAFLDTTDEWFLDKEAGMLYFYNGGKYRNTTLTFYAPGVETFFRLMGTSGSKVQNMIFRNLSFQYGAIFTPPDGVIGTQTTPWLSAAVTGEYANHVIFDGCDFKDLGNSGIWLKTGCTNNTVENCLFQGMGLSAVKIGDFGMKPGMQVATDNTVTNNIIQTGGLLYPSAPGIVLYLTSGNKILHNDISDFRYSGISNGFTWGNVATPNKNNYFGYNNVHHIGWGLMDDMAGIYTLGQSFGTVIENNVIHDIYCHRFGANGIYLDQGSSGITVRNNLVYDCQSEGFLFSSGIQNLITNNIFAENGVAQLFFASQQLSGPPQMRFVNNVIFYSKGKLFTEHWRDSRFEADSNCYWAIQDNHQTMFGGMSLEAWRQQRGMDLHSIVANPGFVNAEAFNFNFRETKTVASIGFKPFSTSEVGVTGSVWKEKAALPRSIMTNFQRSVRTFSTIRQ